MKLILRTFELKLRHTFTISRDSYNTQPTLIVELREGEFSGYGEATSNPYYGVTVQKMEEDLRRIEHLITSHNKTLEAFWEEIYPNLKHNMFALCALDMAYNDLYARKKGQKLYELWNYKTQNNPLTNYTIGIDTIDKMVAKMKALPWPIYKIKLGTKEDIAIVKALRKQTNAIFRIDANCGWTVEETIKNAKLLKELGVEFLEQPLKQTTGKDIKKCIRNRYYPLLPTKAAKLKQM